MKQLLAIGAEINTVNKYGRTPLAVAAGHGYITIVELLIKNDANVTQNDNVAYNDAKLSRNRFVIDALKHSHAKEPTGRHQPDALWSFWPFRGEVDAAWT